MRGLRSFKIESTRGLEGWSFDHPTESLAIFDPRPRISLAFYDAEHYTWPVKKLATRHFQKWAKRHRIDNERLLGAVDDVVAGIAQTAALGQNLYKVRVAREGTGKRGSYRTLLTWIEDDRAIFLYGFEKSEADNLSERELAELKLLSRTFSDMTSKDLETMISKERLCDLTRS